MSLREKYEAAKAARPRLDEERMQMNYALMTFTQKIPQIMQAALDRVSAGYVPDAWRDAMFAQETVINGGWRHYRDQSEKLQGMSGLPAMQDLKAYLSDPAVDIAFTAYVSGSYASGKYAETLRLAINPERPFAESTITFVDAYNSTRIEMTDADKNAWMARHAPKPKLSAPKADAPK